MKFKINFLLVLNVFVCINASYSPNVSGRTFLFTRPACNNVAARMNYWYSAWFDTKHPFAVEVSTLFQQSFSSDAMAHYFLLPFHTSLTIRGSANANVAPATDVRAEWLGLSSTFEGTLSINPTQWQSMTTLTARYNIGDISNISFFNNWALFARFPLTIVENNLNFRQSNVSNAGPSTNTVYDILSAFQNPTWNAFLWWTGTKQVVRLAEFRLGLSKTFIDKKHIHLSTYSAVSIPTCKKQSNRFVFEPQAGFNGHFCTISGVSLQFPFSREKDTHFYGLFVDMELTNFVRNKQWRLLQVQDNPWSYFMNYRKQNQAAVPGVNVFNQYVRVSTYHCLDMVAGFRFGVGSAQAELGGGLWIKNKERLKLINDFENVYGIAGSTVATSASASTIAQLAANDTTFTPITSDKLLFSDNSSSEKIVLYRVHASMGSIVREEAGNFFWGVGSFVEIPSNASYIFKQWGLWAKLGGAF